MIREPRTSDLNIHLVKRRQWVMGLVFLFALGVGFAVWKGFEGLGVGSAHSSNRPEPSNSELHSGNLASALTRAEAGFHSPSTRVAEDEFEQLRSAWMHVLAKKTSIERDAELSFLIGKMTPQLAATLLASLNEVELKSDAAQLLLDHWATAFPHGAILWAQKQQDLQVREPFLKLAAMRWAVVDLGETVSWACGLPTGDFRTEVVEAVATEALRSAPVEALRLGVELPHGPKQTELLARAAAEWAVTDHLSALEWAKQIEDADLRQQVTGQIVAGFANQDPVKAAATALEDMTPGVEQDRAIVTIIQHWAQTAPENVAAWVGEFPDNTLAQDAIESLVNLWGNQDLAAPGDWLKSLPPSTMRDFGVLAYSRALQKTDPELAKQWKQSLPSPTTQERP